MVSRVELELYAIDTVIREMDYLEYNPRNVKWSTYIKVFESKLAYRLGREDMSQSCRIK